MIGTQSLPALAFLAAISGLPNLPGLKGLPTPRTKEYGKAKAEAVAADTLPLPWKPSWRLALENRTLFAGLLPIGAPFGPVKLSAGSDPRRLHVSVDPDSGLYTNATEVGEVTLVPSYRRPLSQYTRDYMARTLQEKWQQKARENVNSLGSNTPLQKTGLSLPIPVRLPQRISNILGPGGPALNVSGSESIRLSGTSNWTNAQLGLIGQKKSLFPSLDMQQDLDIRLEGQLSDRIKVNLLQNSANQVPLANRIAINYRGDEDDFVQALDLGNTSLSLPGTQYVSYSGRNEGLFGVKFASRIGALDFTALASKQEGRSERAVYSGGGASSGGPKPAFRDWDWVRGQYFLLYDPNFGTFYDVDEGSIRLYLDDGNASNDRDFTLGKAVIDPDNAFQMNAPTADTAFIQGRFERLVAGPDKDFEILNNVFAFHDTVFKVIRLKVQLLDNQTLAASYSARPIIGTGQRGNPIQVGGTVLPATPGPDSARTLLKVLRVPRLDQTQTDGRYDADGKFSLVRELELKNIYTLPGSGIDSKTFKLAIQSGQEQPAITDLEGIPFIEILGLDTWNEQNAQPLKAPPFDGELDKTGYNTQTRSWVDYDNGTLMLPDWQPFAPRISGPNQKPFDVFLHDQARRRKILDGLPDAKNAPNLDAYDLVTPQAKDAQYYFISEFSAARSTNSNEITLGRGNILENSEAVMVNGVRWVRDQDYTIDYDLGRITLRKTLAASDQLSVDYSYAPLFAQASKTLLGSAFRAEGRDRSFGGAFLYESKGAQDIRPRLGEEPSRTLITDLNTEWRFKPTFMTRLADALPGVRTTAPSDLSVQAEAGMSFPNPNTRNEVYVDDMEGVRDAVSLQMETRNWQLSSVPRRATTIVDGRAVASQSYLTLPRYWNAELHWFTGISEGDRNINDDVPKEKDLHPRLQDGTDLNRIRPGILALSVPRTPTLSGFAAGDTMWAGLTYNLDAVGVDLSRSQFIELWVSDWTDHRDPSGPRDPLVRGDGNDPNTSVKLHIDLGRVSEDQMRAPNRIPNGQIDTEDLPPRDNQLTTTGDATEDTGLDGVLDKNESGLTAGGQLPVPDLETASTFDPEGDNFGKPGTDHRSAMDPRNYLKVNGTEGNRDVYPVPNTEDLNLNERPDTTEAYFEYTIDMGQQDSPYLVTDVVRDFSESAADSTRNGWRRYRIPISDSLRVRFGSPDLAITQHVRVWISGLRNSETTTAANQRPLLMLGGLDIVGSRWLAADLTPRQKDTLRTSVTISSVNTNDNSEVYGAPFEPGDTKGNNGTAKRREQSIVMEFSKLNPADTLEAFKTFSISEDYSRYGVLRWFATSYDVNRIDGNGKPTGGYDPATDSLFYFVRFATDDKGQTYYEVKRKLPRTTPANVKVQMSDWEEVLAELEKLSVAKLAPDYPLNPSSNTVYRTALANGDSVILRGVRPSFTRLTRISFGVLNQSSVNRYAGQLWFDELRATDIAKDVGLANRVLVNGHWANLMDYNVSWTSRDADFLSVGESRGSGSRNTNLNISTRFEPHRFFEGTGILLPISFSQNESKQRPRFAAGDDIVRTGTLESLSESRSVSRTLSTSYSRIWSDRSNPLLFYTLGGVTANWSRSTSESRNPTNVNNSTSINGGVNYQIAPRQLLQLPLPFTKAKLFPLPERFYWNYGVTTTTSSAFTRTFGSDSLRPSSSQNGRAATVSFGADTRPFDLLSHHFEGQRNLALEGMRQDHLGFINFGRMTSWRQSFSSHLSLSPHPLLRPSFNWSSNYSQNYNLQSEELFQRAINNGQEVSMNMDLPFDKIGAPPGVSTPARPPSPADSGKVARPHRSALPWRGLLARLGTISTDSRIGRTSNYSLISGNASPLYMVGLADNPGFGTGRIFAEPGNVSGNGLDWRGNARTTFSLAYGAQIQARLSYGDVTRDNNGVKSRDRDWRFPDFEVQYGRIANMVGLTHFLDSPQLRTAYARSHSVNYQNSHSLRAGTSQSDDFRPLFSVRGRLRNGTDADLRLERRSTVRESFLLGSSRATDQTTDVNFSLTRSYSQGQKVNFLGKTTTVKTNVSLSLTTVYSRQKGGIKVGNEEKLANPVDRTRLSVNGTGSYGFSSNVTGDLALGFSHFRETNGIYRRSIRVELRGQFRF